MRKFLTICSITARKAFPLYLWFCFKLATHPRNWFSEVVSSTTTNRWCATNYIFLKFQTVPSINCDCRHIRLSMASLRGMWKICQSHSCIVSQNSSRSLTADHLVVWSGQTPISLIEVFQLLIRWPGTVCHLPKAGSWSIGIQRLLNQHLFRKSYES